MEHQAPKSAKLYVFITIFIVILFIVVATSVFLILRHRNQNTESNSIDETVEQSDSEIYKAFDEDTNFPDLDLEGDFGITTE